MNRSIVSSWHSFFSSRVRAITILLLPCVVPCNSQNLVPNSSFEDYSSCVGGTYWQLLEDWTTPLCVGGYGYLNSCNNGVNDAAGVPQSTRGFQYAHTGQAQALLVTYLRNIAPQHTMHTAHLTTPLVAGTTYCVQLWVSLFEDSEVQTHSIQGLFTVPEPDACSGGDSLWWQQAQVTFATDQVDTVSWHLLSAEYTAVGGEEYFTYGNLLPDSLTILTLIEAPYQRCYFVVDDVWVGSCDVGFDDRQQPSRLKLTPNPVQAGEPIRIHLPMTISEVGIEVLDAQGRVVRRVTKVDPQSLLELTTSEFLPGVYMIVARTYASTLRGRFVVN